MERLSDEYQFVNLTNYLPLVVFTLFLPHKFERLRAPHCYSYFAMIAAA